MSIVFILRMEVSVHKTRERRIKYWKHIREAVSAELVVKKGQRKNVSVARKEEDI